MGEEAPTALLSDASRAMALFGPPTVGAGDAHRLAGRLARARDADAGEADRLREAGWLLLMPTARRSTPCARPTSTTRWPSRRRPAGTRTPRTGGSCCGPGSAFAIRDGERVVATALALPYAPALGWVSMVLVHGPYRRRGLATRLVERATAALTGAGLLPVLDATPAGAEVYARMGFRPVVAAPALARRERRHRVDGRPPDDLARARARPRPRGLRRRPRRGPGRPRRAPGTRSRCVDPRATASCSRARAARRPSSARSSPATRRRPSRCWQRGLDAVDGPGRRRRAGARRGPSRALLAAARLRARAAVRPHGARRATRSRATPALVHAIAGPELG